MQHLPSFIFVTENNDKKYVTSVRTYIVRFCEKSLEKVAASCYNGKRQNLRYLIIYVMEG